MFHMALARGLRTRGGGYCGVDPVSDCPVTSLPGWVGFPECHGITQNVTESSPVRNLRNCSDGLESGVNWPVSEEPGWYIHRGQLETEIYHGQ